MAGSFGYKAEHFDVSMAIGERVLFPAVRGAPEAGVVVSGISCRQQVLHGTGRRGRHPVQWLADALSER
jgi:Fe-S oxidoreductase